MTNICCENIVPVTCLGLFLYSVMIRMFPAYIQWHLSLLSSCEWAEDMMMEFVSGSVVGRPLCICILKSHKMLCLAQAIVYSNVKHFFKIVNVWNLFSPKMLLFNVMWIKRHFLLLKLAAGVKKVKLFHICTAGCASF